ncbi:MAG TPA: hypothetical protein V6D18_21700 [Thermosynechococcaceae cyanobacterium]
MQIITGNAAADSQSYQSWFLGHFFRPADDPRSTSALELKWTTHAAGETRSRWAVNRQATTISILVQGQFRTFFRDRSVLLATPGDYVLWLPGTAHWWQAEAESTVLTVRFPSTPGDSVEFDQD